MRCKRFLILLCAVCAAAWISTASAKVVISEVMWMGSDLSTADEWLEIAELGSGTDISGWYITNRSGSGEEKVIVTFASGTTISSGQYLLISNYDADGSRLKVDPDIVTTSISLSNTKLLLRLYNASGSVIDTVDDGVGVPFAGMNASGSGTRASMERINLSRSGSVKENWRTATTSRGFDSGALLLGTPSFENGTGTGLGLGSGLGPIIPPTGSGSTGSGTELDTGSGSTTGSGTTLNPIPNPNPTSIYITEVLANPIGKDDEEWIEIANLGTGTVNIAGWILDEGNSPDHFVIPDSGSGFLLGSGAHIAFPKSITGLPLDNKGEQLSLFSGSLLIDSWSYPETAEQVSYGRSTSGSGSLQAFCMPTEGRPNAILPFDIGIGIQSHNGAETASGVIVGEGKLSINLEARALSGSLASVTCQWNYGDGFLSESCNPPSHAFTEEGEYIIVMNTENYCGTTIIQSLHVKVLSKAKKSSGGGGGSSKIPEKEECVPHDFSGVIISEFLPNPYGEEKDGEWIELFNPTTQTIDLCGWILDDSEEGSRPYKLDGETILPGEYLLLPRLQTGIALNNTGDSVRLGVMVSSSNHAPFDGLPPTPRLRTARRVTEVVFQKSIEGESYALREDGNFVWTPFITPQKQNVFRSAQRRFPTDIVVVSAALPNPVGKDAEGEWIEIANVSGRRIDLTGWFLDNKEGGSKAFSLDGVSLDPNQAKRFSVGETGINLVNTKDIVRILDPDTYTVSIFGWTEAIEGRIYRRPVITTQRASARVVNVVDGDTIDIVLTDMDQLRRIPPSVKRRWLGIQIRDNPFIRVRLIGIDTPETVHPSKAVQEFGKEASVFTNNLLNGEDIEIEFDREIWDKYNRLLAYIYMKNGESIQSHLLRNGFAYTYLRFPFIRKDEFLAFEAEARAAKLGLWSSEEVDQIIQELSDDVIEELSIEEDGLTLEIHPPSGLVSTGTIVTFTPSVSAEVYVSINSGAYTIFSGSYVITENVELRAYAERLNPDPAPYSLSPSQGIREQGQDHILRSEVLIAGYYIEQKKYSTGALISEVYPSPRKGEQEWIEFYNTTNQDIPLAGWTLDDLQGAGSKPWTIPGEFILPANGYLVVTSDQFSIGLNNAGDEVWLISPDGEVVANIEYGKVGKGRSVVEGCLTDVPTPNKRNICRQKPAKKRASKKKKITLNNSIVQKLYTKRSPKKKAPWRIKYKNILSWQSEEPLEVSIPETHRYLVSLLEFDSENTVKRDSTNNSVSEKGVAVSLGLLSAFCLGLILYWPLKK